MEITLASINDIKELKALWKDCFFDEDSVIDMFFDTCFSENDAIVCRQGDEIAAAFYLINANIIIDGNEYKAAYIYAAATHSDYRKKGIMTALLSFSEKLCKERDYDFQFLTPATNELFNYYEKCGFDTAFYKKTICISFDELKHLDMSGKYNFVCWSQNAIELSKNFEALNYKNSIKTMTISKNNGIMTFDCIINDENSLLDTKKYLLNNLKNEKYSVSVPCSFPYEGETTRVGMIKPLNNKAVKIIDNIKIYMGITLS